MVKWLVLLCLFPLAVLAEEPPDVPEGGLTHYKQAPCVDPVWGLKGTCYYSHDVRGNYYMAFFDERDICMFIMQRVDGEYKELWRRGADA